MEPTYVIGLDIGTTSTKAVVYHTNGEVKGSGNVNYSLLVPRPTWAEQDPETIFAAVIEALQTAVQKSAIGPHEIIAIGFSTAMHSLIAVDADHQPITGSITWADGRSVKQAQQLKESREGYSIYAQTGTPIHAMSPLAKLIWMREEDPETFHRAAKFISIKEYVLYHLFGEYVVDHSIASATGLFDITKLDWHEASLQAAGISRDQLSTPVPTTHILRGIHAPIANQLGIDANTPFVVGASDGVLANLGVGAIEPGQVAVTIGTSGAVRSVVNQPLTDPQMRTFCYVLTEKHWVIGGPTNNGGIALRWFRDQFCNQEDEAARQQGIDVYEVMMERAQQVPAGAEGLLFLPYLSGERAPHWNSNARGSFVGMGLHHRREHFIRAVLEGIVFGVYDVERVLGELAGPAQEVLASGGFARSDGWRQIMSDVFGYELLVPQSHESSSFGAALLAMHAIGLLPRLEDGRKLVQIVHRHSPEQENRAVYQELFEIYQRVYANCKGEFEQLANLQRKYDSTFSEIK